MTAALDWPVAHGGAAVVTRDDLQQLWVPGTGPETTWAIASVTKLLTTMATLAACDAGHVDLDQPVDEEGATVRHLLAHASGMPQVVGQGRRRPVGERRIYSNAGFRLLGEVVADAVGTSFPTWLAGSVLEPLGMGSTRLAEHDGFQADPAAGAVTSMDDLVKLARCLLGRGTPVVSAELFAEATTVQFPGLAGLVPGVGRFDPCDWGGSASSCWTASGRTGWGSAAPPPPSATSAPAAASCGWTRRSRWRPSASATATSRTAAGRCAPGRPGPTACALLEIPFEIPCGRQRSWLDGWKEATCASALSRSPGPATTGTRWRRSS